MIEKVNILKKDASREWFTPPIETKTDYGPAELGK